MIKMKRLFAVIVLHCLFSQVLVAQENPAGGARDYTNAILWQQRSGEYRALAFQAYNFARLSLLERLKTADSSKKNCVVVDIDETVLDNSPFQGTELKKGISYHPGDWANWTSRGVADTVPGALNFLRYAAGKNVEVFYITNREESEHAGTLKNLKTYGFPYADDLHLVLKSNTSDKEPRRQKVLENYNILLLCGDNLSDFSNIFYRENRDTKEEVDQAANLFGTRYIVLPNPMYGDWEKQFYKGKNLKESDRSRQRMEGLKTY